MFDSGNAVSASRNVGAFAKGIQLFLLAETLDFCDNSILVSVNRNVPVPTVSADGNANRLVLLLLSVQICCMQAKMFVFASGKAGFLLAEAVVSAWGLLVFLLAES